DLLSLTRAAMRLRPDRIIVGEVRGAEAHALLKVWNTGHPGGVTTIHAQDAKQALRRLEMLVEEAGVKAQPEIIADTISYVVSMERCAVGSRRVSEFVKVKGYDRAQGAYAFERCST
ncbi:MAG TPA: ATPase, T2SS/T4P/T4SS family, partial [Oligoflexia bacterium]|nr:ATPase, T2SS/T4P/T4SS family [Oligoflexia bacterium]